MREPMSRPWTEDHLILLKEMVRTGSSPLRAAAALKRSLASVKSRARSLGTPFPTYAQAKRLRVTKYETALRAATADKPTSVSTIGMV
jgi:hypothetical protein